MRGEPSGQEALFSYLSPETRVPRTHPVRALKRTADALLATLSPTFDAMYSVVGRPSIPPERLLKAQLLIALIRLLQGTRGGHRWGSRAPKCVNRPLLP